MSAASDVTDLIGETPILRLNRFLELRSAKALASCGGTTLEAAAGDLSRRRDAFDYEMNLRDI